MDHYEGMNDKQRATMKELKRDKRVSVKFSLITGSGAAKITIGSNGRFSTAYIHTDGGLGVSGK